MALPSDFQPHQQPHGSPYCSDPNCQICKELWAIQEALRLHQRIPIKKSGINRENQA